MHVWCIGLRTKLGPVYYLIWCSHDLSPILQRHCWYKADSEVSDTARNNMSCYLEYLSPKLIRLSFFSSKITLVKKRSTQQKLIGECDQPWCQNIRAKAFSIKSVTRIRGVKIIRYTTNLEDMDLRDLITPLVHKIVIHFGFDLLWANFEDEYYQKIRGWLEYISSVNIIVDRGVKLAKGLNAFGPRKETMTQSLYKTVYQ